MAASRDFARPAIKENDLLTINYTSGTTSRPKGVMITHRNAYMNSIGTLVHEHMSCADRYLWTLPMFHANGWTFVWTVTAAGATHVCLPKVDPHRVFEMIEKERITMLCAAPTVLISLANADEEVRRNARRGVRAIPETRQKRSSVHRFHGDRGVGYAAAGHCRGDEGAAARRSGAQSGLRQESAGRGREVENLSAATAPGITAPYGDLMTAAPFVESARSSEKTGIAGAFPAVM